MLVLNCVGTTSPEVIVAAYSDIVGTSSVWKCHQGPLEEAWLEVKLSRGVGCFKKLLNLKNIPYLTLFLTFFGVGLRLFNFFNISNQHIPPTLGSKRGFYTYCPSSQAYCLNALFYLYPT